MILAERLCLIAIDPISGEVYPACGAERFRQALSALILVDLIGSGRFVRRNDQLQVADTMPVAHPLLADAAAKLARLGQAFPIAGALALLTRSVARWQSRIRDGLVARDVLELSKSFPFKRRYRLRSRQAWNECVDPIKALANGDGEDTATLALAYAAHHATILAELMDAATARSVIMQLSTGRRTSTETTWIDEFLNPDK